MIERQPLHGARLHWSLVALLTVLTLLPLWVGPYLPMVDLPQHVAQLSIAQQWDDPAFGYQEIYRSNPWVAHRLAPLLILALAQVLPLMVATKLLVSAALLALPLISRRLLVETGGDPWWSLATFPIVFGFAFYFGFLNFIVATPLALLVVLFTLRFVAAPSARRAVWIALGLNLLFFGHLLVLGFCGLVCGLIVLLGARTGKARLEGLAAVASPGLLIGGWFLVNLLGERSSTAIYPEWGFTVERFWRLPAEVVGMPGFSGAAVVGLALLATPWIAGGRPSRRPHRWALAAVAAGLFLFGPMVLLGTAFLSPRFSIFLVPGLLLAFDRRPEPVPLLRRLAVPLLAAFWLASLTPRFAAFNREAEGFDHLVERMEPGRRTLSMIADSRSAAVPLYPFLHFGAWYQVHKGGVVDFSFAEFFVNRYRYRPEHDPPLPKDIEWAPVRFRWADHDGGRYGYFLLRVPDPRLLQRWNPFVGADVPVALVAREGDWLLFEPRPETPAEPAPDSGELEGEGKEEGPEGTAVVGATPEVLPP